MMSLRAAAALTVICLAMVLADCTNIPETLSPFPDNPLTSPFTDACKNIDFSQSFPLPQLKEFPCSIVPPALSTFFSPPFSQLNCFSSGPIPDATETPAEELTS
ncbi:uncharacterized protein LOC100570629 [Acyrthosiphon pisum]|uniref:Uncharacterized protein n=1 Tax=Acyrthosiphon pisum TaxID=7029 RepID=A0A8R2A6M5_ACYPI|nr:uncharacterized protein LOC100570629 [Acyrthosiphon pisum]|eukprot:XP_003244805.1 PREDICTED: uncharacterized protein LOC100570629 [Acyrthosiphon pisum]